MLMSEGNISSAGTDIAFPFKVKDSAKNEYVTFESQDDLIIYFLESLSNAIKLGKNYKDVLWELGLDNNPQILIDDRSIDVYQKVTYYENRPDNPPQIYFDAFQIYKRFNGVRLI